MFVSIHDDEGVKNIIKARPAKLEKAAQSLAVDEEVGFRRH